jgi:glycosyltransferase involved in cell wall biosynthesis
MSTDRLRVLMVLRESMIIPQGGMGIHILEICKCLKKYFDITVVGLGENQDGGLYLFEEYAAKKVTREEWIANSKQWRFLGLFNTNSTMADDVIVQELISYDVLVENFIEFLKDEKFDVVHVHDTAYWLFAKKMSKYFNAPLITTAHLALYISHEYHPSDFWKYLVTREGTAYHESDRIIAVSDYYKQELVSTFMVDEDLITVIPNGVNSELLSGISPKRPPVKCDKLIVYVGRMVPTKGLDTLLDVIEKFPQHHFVLISSIAPTLEEVMPLSKRVKFFQKNFDNVTWLSRLPDDEKWPIMKAADIGVVPSKHEPFGIVALEWMALGVPLIVSDVGGLSEFCTTDNSTPINPTREALEGAIRGHVRDEVKVERARRTAREHSWEATSDMIRNVYMEALDGSI